jgi:hypothetical protein
MMLQFTQIVYEIREIKSKTSQWNFQPTCLNPPSTAQRNPLLLLTPLCGYTPAIHDKAYLSG